MMKESENEMKKKKQKDKTKTNYREGNGKEEAITVPANDSPMQNICDYLISNQLAHVIRPTHESPNQLDYILVKARRGQATDSHSLAERVRREKIRERMKLLQELVPGCNKAVGKADMLDEIINYVQLLQRQVEFLSMKLSSLNLPLGRFNLPGEVVCNEEAFHIRGEASTSWSATLQHNISDTTHLLGLEAEMVMSDTVWEDELQSIVQMGFTHFTDKPASRRTKK